VDDAAFTEGAVDIDGEQTIVLDLVRIFTDERLLPAIEQEAMNGV